jgi:hypothetical protein
MATPKVSVFKVQVRGKTAAPLWSTVGFTGIANPSGSGCGHFQSRSRIQVSHQPRLPLKSLWRQPGLLPKSYPKSIGTAVAASSGDHFQFQVAFNQQPLGVGNSNATQCLNWSKPDMLFECLRKSTAG